MTAADGVELVVEEVLLAAVGVGVGLGTIVEDVELPLLPRMSVLNRSFA